MVTVSTDIALPAGPIKPREYQKEQMASIYEAHDRGVTSQLISSPTGTGKTITFALFAKEFDQKTLVIAHTQELIQQAVDKIQMVWPGVDIGICQGEHKEYDHQVIVASIQSASQEDRLDQLQKQGFSLLIIDEAHHAVASTYLRVASKLGFLPPKKARQSEKLLLGFTATAIRGDRLPLGNVFQEIVFRRSIGSMIRVGYLADLRGRKCQAVADLGRVDMSSDGSDFHIKQLVSAIDTKQRNQLIVKAYQEHGDGKKALAFTADVNHAKHLAEEFMDQGIPAAAVYGAMPSQTREAVLSLFSSGEIQVITNCMVLTEGYDQPDIECLLMARPTKSPTLYTQMVGRGTRIHPGKKECLVLEFTDNDYDVCDLGTLEGIPLEQDQSLSEALTLKIKKEPKRMDASEIISEEYDLIDRSAFCWLRVADKYKIDIDTDKGHYILLLPMGKGKYHALLYQYDLRSEWITNQPVDIDYAQGLAEDWLREHATTTLIDRKARWRNDPATKRQKNLMRVLGISWKKGITKGESSDAISQVRSKESESNYEDAAPDMMQELKDNKIYPGDCVTMVEADKLLRTLAAVRNGGRHARRYIDQALDAGGPPDITRSAALEKS